VFCLLVVLVKLSVPAQWLARKTLLRKPNHGEGLSPESPGRRVFMIFLVYCSIVYLYYVFVLSSLNTWYISYCCGMYGLFVLLNNNKPHQTSCQPSIRDIFHTAVVYCLLLLNNNKPHQTIHCCVPVSGNALNDLTSVCSWCCCHGNQAAMCSSGMSCCQTATKHRAWIGLHHGNDWCGTARLPHNDTVSLASLKLVLSATVLTVSCHGDIVITVWYVSCWTCCYIVRLVDDDEFSTAELLDLHWVSDKMFAI